MIERLAAHFGQVLGAIAATPDGPLTELLEGAFGDMPLPVPVEPRSLPTAPQNGDHGRQYVPAATDLERSLARIWAVLLDRNPDAFGTQDNFFDLGGHSLLAVQLAARLSSELGADVPLQQIFDHPTIAELAPIVATARDERPSTPRPRRLDRERYRREIRASPPSTGDAGAGGPA
jgi:aryl carrier-like protein